MHACILEKYNTLVLYIQTGVKKMYVKIQVTSSTISNVSCTWV